MSEQKLPFHSFKFSLIEGRQPRSLLSLVAPDVVKEDGFYKLAITKGSASNPLLSITREIPFEVALRFCSTLQDLGVFNWEEEYGDSSEPGARRWSMTLVFQKDVFSLSSKGGSDMPARFDEFLEELYSLDFPRPAAPQQQSGKGIGSEVGAVMGSLGVNSIGSMSSGDLGAYAATKGAAGDHSYLKGMFGAQGIPDELKDIDFGSIDMAEMQQQFLEAQRNPEAFQAQMKDAYRHMPLEKKNKLLDMLTRLSGQTREWWKRLLDE